MANARKMVAFGKVKSISDANLQARAGSLPHQQAFIDTLHNLGCEHLAAPTKHTKDLPEWDRFHSVLVDYVGSLVGEYGVSEDKAFKEVVDEYNSILKMNATK